MGQTSLKRKADGIVKLHNLLLDQFHDELAYQCNIDVEPQFRSSEEDFSWRRSSGNKPVDFYLWSHDANIQPVSLEHGMPAVPLYEDDEAAIDHAWVSWAEKWQLAKKGNDFELLRVSLGFYWGRLLSVDEQLFRAEWDQPNLNKERDRTPHAAHPHWHIDWQVRNAGDMSGIHLGMGGWREPGENPKCWQSQVTDDNSLVDWASKTLRYGRQQLRDYPLKYA